MAHRIGIIGLGVMGERMLRLLSQHPSFSVAAAWDPDPRTAEKLGGLAPAARFARSAADLAGDGAVDCVYVAAPPGCHLAYADLAFDHGKAVFCEKPLAVDLAAAGASLLRVERERRVAALNYPFASAPAVRAIASALRSGELGSIERVDIEVAFARWPRGWQASARWLAERHEGGFAREVLSHFVFLTQRLFGRPRLLDCRVDYPADGTAAETAVAARLVAGNVPVTLTGRVGGVIDDDNHWILRARQGAFELYDWYRLRRRINGGWLEVDFGDGTARELSYRAQLDSLAAMLSGQPHHLASFREGLEVQECIEAMLRGQ